MSNKMFQNVPKKPYKKGIFDMFLLWESMSPIIKTSPPGRLKPLELTPEMLDLSRLRNDTEFAEHFQIEHHTLSRWRKQKEYQHLMEKIIKTNWVLKYKKDIDFHFTQRTIKECDAARVKLWKQLYEGWSERNNYNLTNNSASDSLNALEESLKEMAKRPHEQHS